MSNLRPQLPLIRRRIRLLKATQKRNPTWAHYDKYADAIVGIDIRIEEQQACLDYAEEEIDKYKKDLQRLEWKEKGMPNMKEHTNFCDSCKYVRPATLYTKRSVTARNKKAKDAEEKKLRHLCADCRKLADDGKI